MAEFHPRAGMAETLTFGAGGLRFPLFP